MASVYKRKNKDGTTCWRAVVRIKGHPSACDHFERKQEADDWAAQVERQIKIGQYNFDKHSVLNTFADLANRFVGDGLLEHHKSAKDSLRHIAYWKTRFDSYALVHVTPEFVVNERQVLLGAVTSRGQKRSQATVNRYMATLSALFSYAVKQLRWISKSPCAYLKKLKECPGRDRVLSHEEITALLDACRESVSPYLYCVVLIALTTGARQGEILNLEWRDINFDNKLAFIKETKNGRPRSISLDEIVLVELRRLYEVRNPNKARVFASKTAFGRVDIKKAWKTALNRAGIEDCRAHDMRHTFATLAAGQGASNLELATAMGHKTIGMLQRYTHLDAKSSERFTAGIAEIITSRASKGIGPRVSEAIEPRVSESIASRSSESIGPGTPESIEPRSSEAIESRVSSSMS